MASPAHVPHQPNHDPWSREAATPAASYPALPQAPAQYNHYPANLPVQYEQPQPPVVYGHPQPYAVAAAPNQLHYTNPSPDQQPGSKDGRVSKWLKIGGVAAISTIAAGVIGGTLLARGPSDESNENPRIGGDRTASAPLDTNELQSTASMLSSETLQEIAAFDSQRQAVLSEILERFQKDNFTIENAHTYEGRSIELASVDMSPTAILDRNSAKSTYLTYFLEHDEAENQIDIAAQPGSPAYKNFESRIDSVDRGAMISADEDLLIQSKYFENGSLYDETGQLIITANDTPTQVISSMSQRERTNTTYVFQWNTDANGSKGDWRLITSANQIGDPGYINPLLVDQVEIQR